ncbi:MAG: cytochrome c [Pseudomonadota bacterium]
MRAIVISVTGFLICAGLASGEEGIGDRVAGGAFARDVCADCHHVEADEPTLLLTDIKPFRMIAEDPKTTVLSLRVFLRTPHQGMPDFILTSQQTDNVIAYILSLRPGQE